MKIRVIGSMVLVLLCGGFAHATPIVYTFTNASDFTLNGSSYSGPYLGIGGPLLTFTMSADTDNVVTSGSFYADVPGSQFIANRSGVGVVSFGGVGLATMTDPIELVIDTHSQTGFLVDVATGDILLSDLIGPYNGVTDYPGSLLFFGSFPFSPIETSVGPLVITSYRYQGQFSAKVLPASAVPEPSAAILLATGFLGFAGVLRRR